jgi:hypothetical protein
LHSFLVDLGTRMRFGAQSRGRSDSHRRGSRRIRLASADLSAIR